jgi:hypothetical protein
MRVSAGDQPAQATFRNLNKLVVCFSRGGRFQIIGARLPDTEYLGIERS